MFRFYICHKSAFGRCNFCGRCVLFALVKTYGKRFSRQVACFVHVLHLPRKCIWQVNFLLTLHLFALVKTYGKSFLRHVARRVRVLHLPQKHLWQVKFLRTLRLFALLQTDGKSFKASCSPCSGFSFATKVHWQVKSGVRNVAFCLPYCKINGIKRSTQLAHTAIVATSTAILLPLVRFKAWQKITTRF